MSITAVRAHFRSSINSISGYKEWKKPFDEETGPQTIKDKMYHIETGIYSSFNQNHTLFHIMADITVRLYYKSTRNESDSLDSAISNAQTVIKEILKPSNRLSDDIKNVILKEISIEEHGEKGIVVACSFDAHVLLDPDN